MTATRKLLFICGSGHSGSTLLSLLLGAQAGFASLGEVTQTVARMDDRPKPCTCGRSANECPVWGPVLRAVKPLPPGARMVAASRFLAQSVDADCIVDSSKKLSSLTELMGAGLDVDILAIHLVRDGRAVAFSNARKDRSLHEAAMNWRNNNQKIAAYLARLEPRRRLLIRYEDLVADPRATLLKTMAFCDAPRGEVRLDWDAAAQHHLRGNSMRFGGSTEIRPDTSYLDAIGQADWNELTGLLDPALRSYGYGQSRQDAGLALSASPAAQI